MDNKGRPAFRNSRKPYQKGRFVRRREEPQGPVVDSTAAEDLAEYIITILARNEASLKFNREYPEHGHARISVSCDPQVTGRIIGKGGKTVTALRLLARSIAGRLNRKIDIEVAS